MSAPENVGFVGLGDIGAPMATRVLEKGFPLSVWNRTASKMTPLSIGGARIAKNPADLASQTTILCICVDSPDATEDILFGPDGVTRSANSTVEIILDHSTVSPEYTRELAIRLSSHGIDFLDVPVSGGAIGAKAGTLAAMAGGDADLLKRVAPVISSFASQITHMGPAGAGQAAKACNQIINFGNMAALAEAVALASVYGIPPVRIPEAIAGGFAESNISQEYQRSLKADDFSPVRFLIEGLVEFYAGRIDPDYRGKLGILMKDLTIALDMGHKSGVPLPGTTHFDSVFRILQSPPEHDREA